MKHIISAIILLQFFTACSAPVKNETNIEFTARNDQSTTAIEGHFQVRENRLKADSRNLTLHYVKFPSTNPNPGYPIIYLAGGPGGSGIQTAKNRRFELFMALREVADVIALDQRGTGASNDLPRCDSGHTIPMGQVLSDESFIQHQQDAFKTCLRFWEEQGVDLSAYNTLENAADLEDLRQHLGVKKINLWGISYGSHLALAALKTMGDRIHKVVIASAEGLDQTIKYPARTDAYLARMQAAIAAQNPDSDFNLLTLMRGVHEQLDKNPLRLVWQGSEGQSIEYVITAREMKQMASAMISDPTWVKQMIQLYRAAAGRAAPILANVIRGHMKPDQSIRFRPMSIAMDLASGMSQSRRAEIESQFATAMLGSNLNFSYHFTDLAPELDLGDSFREGPHSDVPVLLFSGDLDGRTYIESQREAVLGLSNIQQITIRNAGHNLFKSSTKVIDTMRAFYKGKPVSDETIIVPLPKML